MKTVEVEVIKKKKNYVCEKCEQAFTNKAKCVRHEKCCGCEHNFRIITMGCGGITVSCTKCKTNMTAPINDKCLELLSEFLINHPKEFHFTSN